MKKVFIIFSIIIAAQNIYAQRGGSVIITYPIAFPMGDLHDYISKTSFRGISMEFNRRQKPNVDIGLEVGWNVFYKREEDRVYTDKTTSISGVQFRYTNAVPILLGAKYYKTTGNPMLSPYAGLGLGTTYINRSTDFGLYRITNETWQFCIRPEIGARIKATTGMDALIGAKYYANFGNDDLDGQSFLSINIGFVFFSAGSRKR